MTEQAARAELKRLIDTRGENYAALSRMLGRNEAYIQQYIKRGYPAVLAERDRRALADYFGVDESTLDGAGLPPRSRTRSNLVLVPKLDVRASAGPGALSEVEALLGHYGFDRAWLQRLCHGSLEQLSVAHVSGDSMAPTLIDGDDILVDHASGADSVRDGIYVLQRDEAILVKRVALGPASGKLDITSDNPAYPSWPGCDAREIQIVGRVIWAARRLG